MKVDIIFLSNAKSDELKAITQQSIDTCLASEKDIEFNIIVIEQQAGVTYNNCSMYFDDSEFNYNRFMNKGILLGDSKYICLCNNDLIFKENWCSILIAAMQKNKLLSACPICPHVQPKRMSLTQEVYFGYKNSQHVSGWCIMIDRDILKVIGKLDEEFPFWFADNIYAEQLKRHGIKHGVVRKSVVEHIGSKTLNTLESKEKDNITRDLIESFISKHPRNESAVFFKRNK